MGFEAFYRFIQRNPQGELVSDTGKRESHSFTKQFLEMMYGRFSNTTVNATDTANAETAIVTVSVSSGNYSRVDAPQGDDNYGIQVGTNGGSTAEANANYTIDTLIDHSDVGLAGDLNYQAVTMVAPVVDGANVDFDVSRTFLNETGNNVDVLEIAVVCKNVTDTKYHLLMRDVVTSERVADANTLTVVYTLRTTA